MSSGGSSLSLLLSSGTRRAVRTKHPCATCTHAKHRLANPSDYQLSFEYYNIDLYHSRWFIRVTSVPNSLATFQYPSYPPPTHFNKFAALNNNNISFRSYFGSIIAMEQGNSTVWAEKEETYVQVKPGFTYLFMIELYCTFIRVYDCNSNKSSL